MGKSSFKKLIESGTPTLIDFYADWCGPCKMQTPILKELKSSLGESVKIIKIDVDNNRAISSKLDVRSIPTIMLFQNGELKWQAQGVQTKQVLLNQIKALA